MANRFAPLLTIIFSLVFTGFGSPIFSQTKILSQQDIHLWKKIEQEKLSSDGRWVTYVLASATSGDPILCLWDSDSETTQKFARGTEPRFSNDANYLIFKIKQPLDTLKNLRRKKIKDEDLPKDSLGVLNLRTRKLEKIGGLKNFAVPEKWDGYLFFHLETAPPDTTPATKSAAKKMKKENKDNGWRLVIQHLESGRKDTVFFVKEFVLAEKSRRLFLHTTGRDSILQSGVYFFDFENRKLTPIFQGKGKYQNLTLHKLGNQAAFLADFDTTKSRIRPWQLGFWSDKMASAELISTRAEADFLFKNEKSNPNNFEILPNLNALTVSENAAPKFSDDGSKLFFGLAPAPILNDTSLLTEEIVNVEVWSWQDEYLHPMQKKQLEDHKKRSFSAVFRPTENRFLAVGAEDFQVRFTQSRDADLALIFTEKPYSQQLIWDGVAHLDLFAVNLKTGDKKLISKNLRSTPRLSPSGNFAIWFSQPDSIWMIWNARNGQVSRLTDNQKVKFFNEENDVPDLPDDYGLAGWMANDEAVLIYDKYDIWQFDPSGQKPPRRLTNGRPSKTTFRYLRLDPEENFIISDAEILLHRFHETDKTSGYDWLDLASGRQTKWQSGKFSFSKSPTKARNSWEILFTRENFETFPDLQFSGKGKVKQVSRANPQQSEFEWGSIELVEWFALDGQKLQGMLVKPPHFDASKKYPLVVNFYEKSAHTLYDHRAPDAHRSQINYSIFASRGYLIFNPDIPYRAGYPGESAVNSVLSGISSLLAKGFVDEKRIGIQGHSWGGYQAAYLITKTNLFACAEAGAPVVNMFSAYGGIRWESGRSRIFQYEHQQSRIGGSIWQYPLRYFENSPLFSLDKIQTPTLILANDNDGAVPWYQGIEFFMGLTRLGKPTWLLNYNDEPHWPVKLQNRLDFQIRMEQFFDHFLLQKSMPRWMKRGVPAMEKGILQGLELDDER